MKRKIAQAVLDMIESEISHYAWQDALLILSHYCIKLQARDLFARALNCIILESLNTNDAWMIDELLSDEKAKNNIESLKLEASLHSLQSLIKARSKKIKKVRRIKKRSLCLCCHDYIIDKLTIDSFPKSNEADYLMNFFKKAIKQEGRAKREFLLTNLLEQCFDKYGLSKSVLEVWAFLETNSIHIDLYNLTKTRDLSFLLLSDNMPLTLKILNTRNPSHDPLIDDLMLYLLKARKHAMAFYIASKTSSTKKRLFYTVCNILALKQPSEADLRFLLESWGRGGTSTIYN
jgi:hypothetical protein